MERDEQRSRNYGVDHKLHGMPHGRSEIRILQRLLPNTQMRTRKRLRHLRRLQRIGQLHHSRSYFPALSRRKRKSQGLTPVLFTETGTPPDKKKQPARESFMPASMFRSGKADRFFDTTVITSLKEHIRTKT